MPFKTTPKPLKTYYNTLQRCTTRISCALCNTSVLPKHFENHYRVNHNFDTKTSCVWCQRATWRIKEKHKCGRHLTNCFKNFMDLLEIRSTPAALSNPIRNQLTLDNTSTPPTHPQPFDMTHPFPEKDFFGHAMTHPDPLFEDDSIEELINIPASPLPIENLPPLPVPFQDENLNFAASCVLLYLSGTHDFFHVMVKLVAFESFLEAMNDDRDRSHTLPFSCWCDGGTYQEPAYRQHRHLIVASVPGDHFSKKVWPKIKLPAGKRAPNPNFRCKKLKRIISPRHLVNTIGYLSKKRSRCNFSFTKNARGRMRENHFYLYRTLPNDFKLHLSLLWEGGVLEFLKQTQFQNVSIPKLVTGILTRNRKRQWTQKIKDFYGHRRGLAACVSRDYVPAPRGIITPHFLHLEKEGRKLYFEKLPEKLDPDTWLRKQIEGGNCFYDAVEECEWIPRPRDQKILNYHKPVVDRCRELESREPEWEESNREKDKRIQFLQSKLEEMNFKIQNLTDQIIQYKDAEIARFKLENDRLEHENNKWKQETVRLEQKTVRLEHEKHIQKQENDRLEHENHIQKLEIDRLVILLNNI